MAVIENSHAPVNKSCVQKHMAPATPSSVDCATPYNHCSTASAKKLLKQAIANVSTDTMALNPELTPTVPCVMGGKPNTGHGSNNECEDADINLATQQTDIHPANEAVEFKVPALGPLGRCCSSCFYACGWNYQWSPLCLCCKALVSICWQPNIANVNMH